MKKIRSCLVLIVLLAGCRDKYELPVRDTDVSLLVVEGILNAGTGPTTITLSRTVKLAEPTSFKPELQAKLTVEGKTGGSYNLTEAGGGNYIHAQLPLVIGQEYRLRIRTRDNKEYLSDYVTARQTPTIDSVTWKKENERLVIYANAHDATNNTRYYKWDFDETWEIRSYFPADYRWVSGTTIVYSPQFNVRCWKYGKSNTLILGSTAQLLSDVVSEAPVQFIPFGSEKLGVRYSILLKQQALTKEGYQYLNLMKKNTESIGSIFDPQPSELRGNIKCITTPEEGVIGYLTACTIAEKRFFLTSQEADWKLFQSCIFREVPNNPDSIKLLVPFYLPFAADEQFGIIKSYTMSLAPCVDCTQRGGDLTKPSYW